MSIRNPVFISVFVRATGTPRVHEQVGCHRELLAAVKGNEVQSCRQGVFFKEGKHIQEEGTRWMHRGFF